METIHTWCAEHGVGAIALNASPDAQHLYESMGYDRRAKPHDVENPVGNHAPGLAKPGRFR